MRRSVAAALLLAALGLEPATGTSE